MATFLLKKYAPTPTEPEQVEENKPAKETEEQGNQFTINVTGSVSEVVAKALNKVLANKGYEIEEQPDDTDNSKAQAISTEDINNNPLEAYRSVKPETVLFISSEGFKTKDEDWFLYNISETKKAKVFYTAESFARYILEELIEKREGQSEDSDIQIGLEEITEDLTGDKPLSVEFPFEVGDLLNITATEYCDWAPVENLRIMDINESLRQFTVSRSENKEDIPTEDLCVIHYQEGMEFQENEIRVSTESNKHWTLSPVKEPEPTLEKELSQESHEDKFILSDLLGN